MLGLLLLLCALLFIIVLMIAVNWIERRNDKRRVSEGLAEPSRDEDPTG
jgi:hypothetical protein